MANPFFFPEEKVLSQEKLRLFRYRLKKTIYT